jgi:hypothetical protein
MIAGIFPGEAIIVEAGQVSSITFRPFHPKLFSLLEKSTNIIRLSLIVLQYYLNYSVILRSNGCINHYNHHNLYCLIYSKEKHELAFI